MHLSGWPRLRLEWGERVLRNERETVDLQSYGAIVELLPLGLLPYKVYLHDYAKIDSGLNGVLDSRGYLDVSRAL